MARRNFVLYGNIVDPLHRNMGYGNITIEDNLIGSVSFTGPVVQGEPFIMPGFIDAHVHIESSMLTPPAFAGMAVRHGTVSTVSDPHEIANVCGIDGVRYMSDLGQRSGFKFYFGAPSCVPATPFETAGAHLLLSDIRELFEKKVVSYLAEMMNYPAVLQHDPIVMDKIALAKEYNVPVDGHSPGLKGKDAIRYAMAGITTDHECTTLEEAVDKLNAGMKIIIREGSAAKNYEALKSLVRSHPESVMFCSDDKHPDDLQNSHINALVARALLDGFALMDILRIACINPVEHYRLRTGILQPGDPADMIMTEDLQSFKILSTWIDGEKVYDGNHVYLPVVPVTDINHFGIKHIDQGSLALNLRAGKAGIIKAIDNSLVTGRIEINVNEGLFESNTDQDVIKIVVVNRYADAAPAISLITGFGLKHGAIASSVAHDSHNIVAVGTNDADLAACINEVIHHKGGIAATYGKTHYCLPLPIAGLMSKEPGEVVAKSYGEIDHFAKQTLGSSLTSPFMTLSFMALLVIPSLKLSDLGLFDGNKFQFVGLQG